MLAGSAVADPAPVEAPAGPVVPVPSDMAADEQTAVEAVNRFWARHFGDYFGRPYRPPGIRGGYVGQSGPRCGGVRSLAGNAFYCRPGDFLAWDQGLMNAGYQKVGDSWVYVIIAHEWGHAIQARLNRGLVSQADELQADCLAGGTLEGARKDGSLTFDSTDSQEIADALVMVADRYAWSDSRDHGSARQRVDAYNTGATGGVPACFRQ